MAEAQTPPTFKLVLVGDGGTGKVSWILTPRDIDCRAERASLWQWQSLSPDGCVLTVWLLPNHPLPRDCQQ